MILFSKEKDLMLRITNLILLIGFIATLIIFYNGTVSLLFNNSLKSYAVFEEETCDITPCDEEDNTCSINEETTEEELECQTIYDAYKEEYNSDKIIYEKRMIASALSAITVAFAIYFINKGHKKKVKK